MEKRLQSLPLSVMFKIMERITINPEQCGGRPCVRGMRIRVKDVLDMLAGGATAEEILGDYPDLEAEDIRACLAYASRYLDHSVIVNFAAKNVWVVVTKDDDIVERAIGRKDGARVVWLRIGNSTNNALFAWLEPLWTEVIRQLQEGQRVIEVRRD